MLVSVLSWVALGVFLGGLLWRVSGWFRHCITVGAERIPPSRRLLHALRGMGAVLCGPRLLVLLRSLLLDVTLQLRTFREDRLRWAMHLCIWWGCGLLVVIHALAPWFFPDHPPTLNPFRFLRDLGGLMVIAGAAIAAWRRWHLRGSRLRTNRMDAWALAAVALIVCSGLLLEGLKMSSYSTFHRMVQEYADLEGPQDERALAAWWAAHQGLYLREPLTPSLLQRGAELHEESCAACHSRAQWAFAGWSLAHLLGPLGKAGLIEGLRWFHLLLCLFALAWLPFGKLLHLITTPLSLLTNAVVDPQRSHPAGLATKQMLELDACTHCGTCALRCSMAPVLEELGTEMVLPSERMALLKRLAWRRPLSEQELDELRQGVWACTSCLRCTVVCPAGIDLQELWFHAREALLERGLIGPALLTPLGFPRALRRRELPPERYEEPSRLVRQRLAQAYPQSKAPQLSVGPASWQFKRELERSARASTFSVCFGCQTCTNACPVVAAYEDPQQQLDLLPHQIMHACALGLRDLALGSEMVRSCLTCYRCQEQCPQGVQIAEVISELKTLSMKAIGNGRQR